MTTTTSAAAAAATSSDETIQTSQIARTRHVIVTVIGATGHQGSGVVAAFLRPSSSSSLEDGADNPEYAVRAVSSNPSGSKSQALLSAHPSAASSPRLTLVQADLANVESLKEAIRGSDGVFFAGPFMPGEGAKAEESEEAKWGRNVVDAVKACGVEHFIYSSLNHLSVLSKGKYVNVVHEDAKALVAQYAQAQLKAVTLLIPPAFYSNLAWPLFARREKDGTVTICVPVDPEVKMEWVDEGFDIGNFAAAAFRAGPAVTGGKTYPVCSPRITPVELAQEYERATGEQTRVQRLSLEEARQLATGMMGESAALELTELFSWLAEVPEGTICSGAMKPEDDTSYADLSVKASSLTQFLQRTGFRVPPASISSSGELLQVTVNSP
ncbi:hypothetical protein JCM8115_006128 [Rhodotorula mucilaginosa]